LVAAYGEIGWSAGSSSRNGPASRSPYTEEEEAKTKRGRHVPIEPTLRPLLEAMHREARGVGLIAGCELVADRATRRAFAPTGRVGAYCLDRCHEHGLIVRNIGDTIALCPPLVITESEIDELFDRLERALDDTLLWVEREGLRG